MTDDQKNWLLKRARELRRDQTDVEQLLWSLLRNRQMLDVKFRRQHRIGPYIADFVSVEHKLVMELDGGQHAASAKDAVRTHYLEDFGWRVLRF